MTEVIKSPKEPQLSDRIEGLQAALLSAGKSLEFMHFTTPVTVSTHAVRAEASTYGPDGSRKTKDYFKTSIFFHAGNKLLLKVDIIPSVSIYLGRSISKGNPLYHEKDGKTVFILPDGPNERSFELGGNLLIDNMVRELIKDFEYSQDASHSQSEEISQVTGGVGGQAKEVVQGRELDN